MKETIFAYNPYIRAEGGGERYFLSALESLSRQFNVCLLCSTLELPVCRKLISRYALDFEKISILSTVPNDLPSDAVSAYFALNDFFCSTVPNTALFFQITNTAPFLVPCSARVCHQQLNRPQIKNDSSIMEFIKDSFRQQDALFFPTLGVQNHFLDFLGFDISHWVTYPPLSPLFEFSSIDTSRPTDIITVGRFCAWKGQLLQLKLFNELTKIVPNIQMTMVGPAENDYFEEVRRYRDKMRLPVELLIGLDSSELREAYSSAKIFWSTTDFEQKFQPEPFGLTTIEAMACGCVPILPCIGGAQEIVNGADQAVLISNPQDMVRETANLLVNTLKLREIGKRASESAKRFSLTSFFSKDILSHFAALVHY